MRNLLLVDDERNIVLGLKAMTEREFPGEYRVHLANDGEEALAILTSFPVDIAVCDIRMPRMDGIELIRRISAMDKKPMIMILSGHEDFRYAKEAIRYDVKEYLLKPVVREEFYRTLRRLEEELQKAERTERRLDRSEEDARKLAESTLGNVLLHPSLDGEAIRRMLGEAGMDWMEESFRVGVLKPMIKEQSDKEQADKESLAERFDRELLPLMEGQTGQFARIEDKEHRLVLVAGSDFFDRLSAVLLSGRQPLASFSLGLSHTHSGMERIKKAHGEASLALRHNFLQRRAGIVDYGEIEMARTRYELPEQDVEKLYNMIGTERDKEMSAILYGMFREELLTEAGYRYVETVSGMLNERIFDRVFRLYGKESVEILRLFKQVSSIGNFDHLHEYVRSAEELLTRLHRYVKSLKSVSVDNRTMKEALQYIHDHYDKDINMTMVSNSISLNYYYFSQSFKDYTGDNFVDYLRKLRIAKAKEMLASTDLKVYEIAGRAGFANIKHFNRVFRKLEGISPLEYREQQQIHATRKK